MSVNVIQEECEDKNNERKQKKTKAQYEKGDVDTSNFSIEERLVSAVWVHERKFDKTSIAQIKINFRKRFGKAPPTKNTLYFWEKKLFSTGKVMDAKRSGRPCRRKAHIPSVEASLQQSPGLSLRARAEQLALPRTTLIKILKEDLHIKNINGNSQCSNQIHGNNSKSENEKPQQPTKQQKGDKMKKQIVEQQEQLTNNIPCTPAPPPPAYTYPDPPPGSIPFSALQHYLSYPTNKYHRQPPTSVPVVHPKILPDSQNYNHNVGMTPHMLSHPHQPHHAHHMNHHGYQTNPQMLCKYDGFHVQ